MTEEEWLSADDPGRMWPCCERFLSDRQRRLFAVACCERVMHLLIDKRSQNSVQRTAEYADSLISADELQEANCAAEAVWAMAHSKHYTEFDDARTDAAEAAANCSTLKVNSRIGASAALCAALALSHEGEMVEEMKVQAVLLRDIIGPLPFRSLPTESFWLTPSVQAIASSIYADRAFDRLPNLADALEDAGCENSDFLAHCRYDGPHVRGCWVVDLLLEKE